MLVAGSVRCRRPVLLAGTALRATCLIVLAAPMPLAGARAQLAPNAAPVGGTVVGGSASISQGGGTTAIVQSTPRAAIDWQSFNVGSQQSVTFHQPTSNSIALNTVVGPNPSEIAGRISANGQVVIVNQAGVLFDHGAQIDTAGLVVSASGISRSNFMAGKMVFDGAPRPGAQIVNNGNITIQQAGLAALVAPQVANHGLIAARLGRVIVAGAAGFTLDLYGDGLTAINVTSQVTSVQIGGKSVPALVTNSGTILADGGSVLLSAQAVDGLVQTLVDAGGTIAARSVGAQRGRVLVAGMGGGVTMDGTVLATGTDAGSTGGTVEASADGAVTVAANATIDASGDSGGGQIALGGRIGGAAVAASTTVASGAVVAAQATRIGQGGTVTVRSRQHTSQAGRIVATGGSAGGNGGSIEVSTDGLLELGGSQDASADAAAGGSGGSILLADASPNALLTVTQHTIDQSTVNGGTLTISAGSLQINQVTLDGGSVVGGVTTPTAAHYVFRSTLAAGLGTIDIAGAITADGSDGGTAPQTIDFEAGGSITVGAGIAATGDVILNVNGPIGSIRQTGGIITAQQLTGTAPGTINLSDHNAILQLGGLTAGGALSLDDSAATSLTVSGTVRAGSALTPATIAITAPSLAIGSTGTLTATGGTIALASATGDITGGSSSALTAGVLTLVATTGSAKLIGTNAVATLGDVTTHGTFSLLDGSPLNVAGKVVAGQGVNLLAGTLTIASTGSLQGGTYVVLQSDRLDTQGGITAPDVLLSRFSAGTITVGGAGSTINGGDLAGISAGTLAIGSTDGATVDPQAHAITIAANLPAGGKSLGLFATGTIAQTGVIQALTLFGSAGSAILEAGNTIADLGDFTTTSGDFSLADGRGLVVQGQLDSAGDADLVSTGAGSSVVLAGGGIQAQGNVLLQADQVSTAGTITTPGTVAISRASTGTMTVGGIGSNLIGAYLSNVDAGLLVIGAPDGAPSPLVQVLALNSSVATRNAGPIALYSGGAITEQGTIATSVLSGAAAGNVSLATAQNQIGQIAGFTAKGDITVADAVDLRVSGTLQAGSLNPSTLSLTAPTITVADASPGTLTGVLLSQQGTIVLATDTLTNAGTITTGGTKTGRVQLDRVTAGTLTLADGGLGVIATGELDLGTPGGPVATEIDLNGAIDLTGTATTLGLFATGAVISGPDAGMTPGSIAVGTLTGSAGSATLAGANAIATLAGFTTTGGPFELADVGHSLAVTGRVAATGGDVALSADSLTLSAGIATAGTLTLVAAAGTIGTTGTTFGITAGTLTGSATGAAMFSGSNTVDVLGDFTAGTGPTDGLALLNDTVGLTVVGTVSAPGTVTLASSGTGGVRVAPTGSVAGTAGVVLQGDTIDTAGSVTTNGAVFLTRATPGTLTIGGPRSNIVGADLGNVQAGSLVLGSVDGTLASPLDTALVISGTLAASPTQALGLFSGHDITEVSADGTGAIVAGVLFGNAVGGVTLTGANQLGTLAGFTTGGNFSLTDAPGTSLFVSNSITTGSTGATAVLAIVASGITLASGATLLASGGTVDLTADELALNGAVSTGNTLTGLIGITGLTAGTLSLDADRLSHLTTGTLSLGSLDDATPSAVVQGISIASALDLAGHASALGLFTAANGTVTTDGLTVRQLSGNTGAADLGGANTIGTLAGFIARTGALTLDDSGTLSVTGTVSGASGVSLSAAAIDQTGGLIVAPGGDLSLVADGSILFAGTLQAGSRGTGGAYSGTATLKAKAGDLTEQASGILLAGTLTGGAGFATGTQQGTADLSIASGNTVSVIGQLTVAGDFTLEDDINVVLAGPIHIGGDLTITGPHGGSLGGDLVISGDIATQTGNLKLSSADGIIQTGGTIQAGHDLTLTAGNGIIQTNGTSGDTPSLIAGGTLSLIAQGQSATGHGAVSTTGISLGGDVQGGTVLLQATHGGVQQAAGSVLAANLLTATASQAIALTGTGNRVAALGDVQAASLSLTDAIDLAVTGTIVAPALIALTTTGALTESGVLQTATLTGSTGGAATLDGANAIGSIGSFTAGGSLLVADAGGLILAGPITVAGTATLGTTGDIQLTGTLAADAAVLTATGGSLTEAARGALEVGLLAGSARNVTLAVDQGNTIATVGSLAATAGDLMLTDDTGLTIAGPVTATGLIDLQARGALLLAGHMQAGDTLRLASDGSIIQTDGSIAAGSGLTLAAAGGIIQASGGVLLAQAGTLVLQSGTAGSASHGGITTTGIDLGGTITAPALVLTAPAGPVNEEAGASITADTLSGSSSDAFALGAGTNAIGTLAGLSGASILLADGTALAIAGPVQAAGAIALAADGAITEAGGVSVAAGSTLQLVGQSIAFAGTLSGAVVTLDADAGATPGDITEGTGGVLLAGLLQGDAANADLAVAQGNTIGTLGSFTTTGDLIVENDTGLMLAGPLSVGGTLDIHGPNGGGIAGDLLLGGTIDVAHGSVAFNSQGGIIQTGGTLQAANGLALIAGDGIIQAAGTDGTPMLATTGGTLLLQAGGTAATSFGTVTTTGISFAGILAGPAVVLDAPAGDIAEGAAGSVQAGTLSGLAVNVLLNPASGNQIAALGTFAATGDLALEDDTGLTLAGPLSVGGNLDIFGPDGGGVGGDLMLTRDVFVANGTATLSSAGGIIQAGGTMLAGQGITLLAADGIIQAQDVTPNVQAPAVNATGTGPAIVSGGGTLTLSAGGAAATSFGGQSTTGIAFDGVLSGPTVVLTASAGDLTEGADGSLSANLLTGQARVAALDVVQGNTIGSVGSFATVGDLTLEDDTGLTLAGPLTIGGALDIHGPNGGGIAGDLVLDGLVDVANSTIAFDSTAGIIQAAGTVHAGSGLTLRAGDGIIQAAGATMIADGGTLSLRAGGGAQTLFGGTLATSGILFAGTLAAPATVLVAADTITELAGGALRTGALSGSAASANLAPAGGNSIAALAGFATTGALVLEDDTGLTIAGTVSAGGGVDIHGANGGGIGGDLVLAASLLAPGAPVVLTAAGAIVQTGGVVQAGLLSGSAASVQLDVAQGNTITALGVLTTTGDLLVEDDTGLTVTGPINVGGRLAIQGPNGGGIDGDLVLAGDITVPNSDIVLRSATRIVQTGGTVRSGGTLALAAADLALAGVLAAPVVSLTTGTASQDANGAIQAGLLGIAASGAVALSGANSIAALGQVAAASFSLADLTGLAIDGTVAVPGVLALQIAGGLTETGGIQAGTLTGEAGAVVLDGSNAIATLGDFTADSLALNDAGALAVAGRVAAGQVALGAGALAIPGSIAADSLMLAAGGDIVAPGALQVSGVLSGSAGGSADLSGGNTIAALGDFAAGGGFTLNDLGALAVGGVVRTGGAMAITAAGIDATGTMLAATTLQLAAPTGNIVAAAGSTMIASTGGGTANPTGGIMIQAPGTVSLGGMMAGASILVGTPTGSGAIASPVEVDWAGNTIVTGSSVPTSTVKPVFPVSGGTLAATPAGVFVYAQSLLQGGTTTINPDGSPATAVITLLPGAETIELNDGGLVARSTNLFLNLDNGSVNGSLDVAGLNVNYTFPGSGRQSNLSGLIGGVGGQGAAAAVYVTPVANPNLRINACPLESVACILLSPIIVPVTNPVEDVIVEAPRRRREDDDLIIPNVGEQDF